MIKVLAIETSCDETGIAIVQKDRDSYKVVEEALHSQVEAHKEYGGVFPMLAKREHGKNLLPLLQICLSAVGGEKITIDGNDIQKILSHLDRERELQSFMEIELNNPDSFLFTKPDIETLVVTAGPGLEPALWVGISFAKALSLLWNIPILPMNHMEGHIASILATAGSEPEFPALTLLISGGHTEVVSMSTWGEYKVIGKTRDDAVGEAYDKVARILGLEYPGGPEISKRAQGLRDRFSIADIKKNCTPLGISLPRPMLRSHDSDFSFSGLKTAVLYLVRDLKKKTEIITDEIINLICAEFEEAVVEVLLSKLSLTTIRNPESKSLIVAGGVIANSYIRENLEAWCVNNDVKFLKPSKELATDNAVMIALAGLVHIDKNYAKIYQPTESELSNVTARGGWKIDDVY